VVQLNEKIPRRTPGPCPRHDQPAWASEPCVVVLTEKTRPTGRGLRALRGGTHGEALVQLVGQQGVGQLSEVQLAEGAHRVYVLPEDLPGQVRDLLRVKLMPGQGQRERERERETAGGWRVRGWDGWWMVGVMVPLKMSSVLLLKNERILTKSYDGKSSNYII